MKHLLLVIAICALALFYFPTGCGSSGGGDSGSQSVDDIPQTADPVVQSIRDLGVIRTNPMILKRDCGFSARYQDRSVWVFGDTMLESPNAEDELLLSSSCSSTFDSDAGDGVEGMTEEVDAVGAPQEFFPLTEEEEAYNARNIGVVCEEDSCTAHWRIWPGTVLVDEDKDWAYVFYRKILAHSGVFKFQHVGHSIAIWKGLSEPVERPVFDYFESYPTLFFTEGDGDGFGSAAIVAVRDAYIYGCELGPDKLTKPCNLARVPLADILEKEKWSYFAGNGSWSSSLSDSTVIFHGNDMMSVFFNPYIGRYAAIYSEPLGSSAMLRTAARPEGPWSEPIKLFTVDAPENIYGWVYDFLAHPEMSPDDGRTIYITYTKKLDQMHSEMRLVAIEFE